MALHAHVWAFVVFAFAVNYRPENHLIIGNIDALEAWRL